MNRTGHIGRTAGLGLISYGLGAAIAFATLGAPGGDYEDTLVPSYVASSHWPAAFAIAYLGAISTLGLLLFGGAMRRMLPRSGDLVWGLSIAAVAVSVVGWFVDGGLVVAMAEGGHTVQSGVPDPVVYTITEIGNLLAVCAPAFFIGVAAIVLARARRAAPLAAGLLGGGRGVRHPRAGVLHPVPVPAVDAGLRCGADPFRRRAHAEPRPGGCGGRGHLTDQGAMPTYLVSRYSSMPSVPPSRPKPDCLDAAERRRRVGDDALVDADHAGLQALG